ncbi:MAG TPA: hypothetical protein VLE49_00620, partial [Anaerolineales bacterium]|nr:hypothetical protein [Anaerolineales bacterium]
VRLILLDKPGKRFVVALLCLDDPGKFIIHSRSLYLLYARQNKKLQHPQIRTENWHNCKDSLVNLGRDWGQG